MSERVFDLVECDDGQLRLVKYGLTSSVDVDDDDVVRTSFKLVDDEQVAVTISSTTTTTTVDDTDPIRNTFDLTRNEVWIMPGFGDDTITYDQALTEADTTDNRDRIYDSYQCDWEEQRQVKNDANIMLIQSIHSIVTQDDDTEDSSLAFINRQTQLLELLFTSAHTASPQPIPKLDDIKQMLENNIQRLSMWIQSPQY